MMPEDSVPLTRVCEVLSQLSVKHSLATGADGVLRLSIHYSADHGPDVWVVAEKAGLKKRLAVRIAKIECFPPHLFWNPAEVGAYLASKAERSGTLEA